jgi:hypothetical protein
LRYNVTKRTLLKSFDEIVSQVMNRTFGKLLILHGNIIYSEKQYIKARKTVKVG